MNNTKSIGLFALLVVGLLFSTAMVSAYKGDYAVKGPDCTPERHEQMIAAFENSDYTAWSKLMEGKGVLRVVNEDNFDKFAKAHTAGKRGDFETASKIRAELGLNDGVQKKDGQGFGKLEGNGLEQRKGQAWGNPKHNKNWN